MGLLLHGLDRPLSGVTRVALELARALDHNPGCQLVVLSTSRTDGALDGIGAPVHRLRGCSRAPGLILLGGPLIAIAARRLALDVIHDPVGASPFTLGRWAGRYGRVLTIHDAIAFADPKAYAWTNALIHRLYVPATLRNVDAIVAVSAAAQADIERSLGLPPGRVAVVPNGVASGFRPIAADQAAAVARLHGIDRPYLLNLASAQRRKNAVRLLAAFARVRERIAGLELVLAGAGIGDRADVQATIDHLRLADDVVLPGPIPERHLPALYAGAQAFVFPSESEGFGLPVLEAMACGTPVVCSEIASLAEVAGDAALRVDPHDTDAIADAIIRVVEDRELAASLRARGLARASVFTWERAARDLVRLYGRVAPDVRVAS